MPSYCPLSDYSASLAVKCNSLRIFTAELSGSRQMRCAFLWYTVVNQDDGWGRSVTFQTVDRTSCHEAEVSFSGPSELQPLLLSVQSVLTQIDDEYERERDKLSQTLPNTSARDRALVVLQARHLARRENYVRELATLIGQPQ